jgi:hypothetical protein
VICSSRVNDPRVRKKISEVLEELEKEIGVQEDVLVPLLLTAPFSNVEVYHEASSMSGFFAKSAPPRVFGSL